MKSLMLAAAALLWALPIPVASQDQSGSDASFELYRTQIAAAEALLELNEIRSANDYLAACDERYRDVEWRFLKSRLDQSATQLRAREGSTFADAKVSPGGNILATAGADSVIALYTYPGLAPLRKLTGHKGAVTTLAFSSDGTRLASGGRDHAVVLWDVETGTALARNDRSFSQGVYQVRFGPGDSVVGVVSWERLADRPPHIFGFFKLLDATTAGELRRIELDNHPAAGVVFTPDGEDVILSTWGEVAYSYRLRSGTLNWKYDLSDASEYNAFHSIDISPDGASVALGATDRRVHLLDAKLGTARHRIEPWAGHSKIVKAVAFSRDGSRLATAGEDQSILVWDAKTLSRQQTLVGHIGTVTGLAWAADGSALVSASLDGTLRTWDLARPSARSYDVCDFGPWQTPLAPDGRSFAAPSSDKKLIVYEAASGKPAVTLGAQSGLCADFSGDGKRLVTASFDGVVRLWDIPSARETASYHGHAGRVDGVAYMDATAQVLSVGDTTLRVWGASAESAERVVPIGKTPFRIVLSPDERTAYVGFGDGKISAIDTKTWTQTHAGRCLEGIQELAVSPDGEFLAAFSGAVIEIWATRTMTRRSLLRGHQKSGYGLGFSPDGRYLVSGSSDQTFKLWNLAREACTLTYHGYDDVVYSSKFLSADELHFSSSEGKIWYFRF